VGWFQHEFYHSLAHWLAFFTAFGLIAFIIAFIWYVWKAIFDQQPGSLRWYFSPEQRKQREIRYWQAHFQKQKSNEEMKRQRAEQQRTQR